MLKIHTAMTVHSNAMYNHWAFLCTTEKN